MSAKSNYRNSRLTKIGNAVSKEAYFRILKESRQGLSPMSRIASIIIHNNIIDFISNFIFKYILRTNSVLFASVVSFLVILLTLIMSLVNKYSFSGFEIYLGFIIGWIIGYLFDLYEFIGEKLKKSTKV